MPYLVARSDGVTPEKQDAVFYAGVMDTVAVVSNENGNVEVVSAGDTRALVWPSQESHDNGDTNFTIVRNGFGWADVGIASDADLRSAELRTEWEMNSWFELYDPRMDSYTGDVFHTVDEAIEGAKAHLGASVQVMDYACEGYPTVGSPIARQET
jgi:hypothetical protein